MPREPQTPVGTQAEGLTVEIEEQEYNFSLLPLNQEWSCMTCGCQIHNDMVETHAEWHHATR